MGAQMRFLYVNGDGTRELMRDSFSAIGEYLDSQAQIRENAVIVLLEAVEYPFYDTIRDGMYFYEIGGKLYTWIPHVASCAAVSSGSSVCVTCLHPLGAERGSGLAFWPMETE